MVTIEFSLIQALLPIKGAAGHWASTSPCVLLMVAILVGMVTIASHARSFICAKMWDKVSSAAVWQVTY